MPKLKRDYILAPEKHFLAIPDHYVNVTAKIAYSELKNLVVKNTTGKVYTHAENIPAGTVVHVTAEGEVKQPNKSSQKPNAIIFDTIETTLFDESDVFVNATVLVHGFVREDRLYQPTAQTTELGTADFANGMIYFFKK